MFFKQIYLVFRHFLPTFILVFVGSAIFVYFQVETVSLIIFTFFFGWIQSFYDKYVEIGNRLKQENEVEPQEELPPYNEEEPLEELFSFDELPDVFEKEEKIIRPAKKENSQTSSQIPLHGQVFFTGVGKVVAYLLAALVLVFLISFMYMYFFFYP